MSGLPAPRPSTEASAQPSMEAVMEMAAGRHAEGLGVPRPELQGKMLRPRLAWSAAPEDLRSSPELASGMLAIQMVHEASLLHDDILDDAETRRGRPSGVARHGLAAALVGGDHLLTSAYRVAQAVGSPSFMDCFTRAVERTVAGEKAQGRAMGRELHRREYVEIVSAKSGELFGAAVALPICVSMGREGPRGRTPDRDGRLQRAFDLGVRIGCLYQMVDDFLDLCPDAELGKAPRQDYRQGKWTWPLEHAGVQGFDLPDRELTRHLFGGTGSGPSPMRRAFGELIGEISSAQAAWAELHPVDREVPGLLDEWGRLAASTLDREEASRVGQKKARRVVREEAQELGEAEKWTEYFAHHSRSFHFSARLFPSDQGRIVTGVYTFCRFTDDLVDRTPGLPPCQVEARLEAWRGLIQEAHDGGATGIPLLDEVMGETRRRGISPRYAHALVDGVAMDLRPALYPDLDALRTYSYHVASVVGLWLTELFGVRDPWVLQRAEALGHAMQLTNILRDVGEDLRRGRLYLPLNVLEEHGVDRGRLEWAASQGGPLPRGYPAAMEALMGVAEAEYDRATAAIPALPTFFQRPVAVAARVYRGIHGEIRRNGYDSLRQRAVTSLSRKIILGGRGLWELRGARRSYQEDRT